MQEFKREPSAAPSQARQEAPPRRSWLRTIMFSGEVLKSWPANAGLLLLRVPTGIGLAVLHGWQKLPPPDTFVLGLDARGFPGPYFLALGVGILEVLAGVCLALGLMTRIAAAIMASILGVAIFVWHASDTLPSIELAFAYFFPSLFFVLVGGGLLSFDALLRRGPRQLARKLDELQ